MNPQKVDTHSQRKTCQCSCNIHIPVNLAKSPPNHGAGKIFVRDLGETMPIGLPCRSKHSYHSSSSAVIPIEVRITVTSKLRSSCRETSSVAWRRKDVTKYAQAPEKGVIDGLHTVGSLLATNLVA